MATIDDLIMDDYEAFGTKMTAAFEDFALNKQFNEYLLKVKALLHKMEIAKGKLKVSPVKIEQVSITHVFKFPIANLPEFHGYQNWSSFWEVF